MNDEHAAPTITAVRGRIEHVIRKRLRAARWGVFVGRTDRFRVPSSLWMGGRLRSIYLPKDHGTKVAFLEILADDDYRIEAVTRPVRTVLDIGAHAGLFSLAARRAFPEATIHAYEPNPAMEPYLRIQAGLARCQYFMEAIACSDGMVSVRAASDSVTTKTVHDAHGEVRATSLSHAIERLGGTVDLLKMDCEGAEWDLFDSTESWRVIRHVAMEYHLVAGHTLAEAIERLGQFGFAVDVLSAGEGYGLLRADRNHR